MKKIICLAAILTLSGCTKNIEHHGYSFDQNNIHIIKVGESDYGRVLHELGTPTSKSDLGNKTIYYINYTVEKVAFWDPKITEQRVLSISFDSRDIVSNISEYTLDDANEIAFSENKTKIHGNTLTPIEQIMTNIGKFNKKQAQY